MSWPDRKVYVQMTREAIKTSPQWNEMYPIQRAYEEQLRRHYSGIPGWSSGDGGFPERPVSPAPPPRR